VTVLPHRCIVMGRNMPQLVVEQPGVQPITVDLTNPETCFGRAEDNDVVLVADEVSRHHAKVLRRNNQFIVADLQSLNGTYVNRQRIVQRVLAHLDEVWFGGKCRLVYRDEQGVAASVGAPQAAQQPPSPEDSAILTDLERIREEMDRVGNNMTMIGKRAAAPQAQAQAKAAAGPTQDEILAMGRAYRRLAALYQASKLIASEFDLRKRLTAVLDTAIEVMEADRGFLMLRDEITGRLMVSVAREMGGQELTGSSPSMGVAGKAANDGVPVIVADLKGDAEFSGRESIIRQQLTSAMCVPLKMEERNLGSIYLDTRKFGRAFKEEDLELFMAMASQLAMAIDNVRLYQRMLEAEKTRANLGRFLSPSIVDQVMRAGQALELGGTKRTVTSMFCDVRGFTPIAERLGAQELVGMLNEHFTAMTEIVFANRGTLDKFIGDEIMAVFGSPLTGEDDPARCAKTAVEIQAKNAELNAKRAEKGLPLFELGIGIATGDVIAGYVGSPQRMEFTVVGDRVNTARRLCAVAEPGETVCDETTYESIQDMFVTHPHGTRTLKGKEEMIRCYQVLGLKGQA
jgi:adenylate cyclase